ncbi:MAG: hypothetical protein AB1425_10170 [Actinomycetota bacterium]
MEPARFIGFDRKVRLSWLDATAEWAARGMDAEDIRKKLDFLLEGEVSGKNARRKTKTVLLRVWVPTSEELKGLRGRGLELFPDQTPPGRLALHWGMSLATYPFLRDVATTAGRLLNLQGAFSVPQARSRLAEVYGEREILARALRHVLRSMVEWDVLREADEKGVYLSAPKRPIENEKVVFWLIEAMLRASGSDAAALSALLNSAALFPFEMGYIDRTALEKSGGLEIYRQSLDEDLVMLPRSAVSR